MTWIDTHVHLDAAEFAADRPAVVARARAAGVAMAVLPSVDAGNWEAVRGLAHGHGWAYALGIHPLCVDSAADDDLDRLAEALERHRDDPRLVAVGEIGIDRFVPGLDPDRQARFYAAQLKLAQRAGLPVIVHVRRSADDLLKHLRRIDVAGGIVHAFNASDAQADVFVGMGLRLGFGGAMTFERALQIRRLAARVPDGVPVLETDAPDIPPQWRYRTVAERGGASGAAPTAAALSPQARNEPAEVPRIAETLAQLRGWPSDAVARQTTANACAALPKLAALLA